MNDKNYNAILREALDRYDNAHREANRLRDDYFASAFDDALQRFNKSQQVTNGDKLRSMTNEQLARYLWIETDRMTPEEWLDWLNAT